MSEFAPGGIERLLEVMRQLRDPDSGCPWDIRQDFASIAPYTIEEAYEVADAIHREDFEALRCELGDLLLQVAYHARMAEEAGKFTFEDVVESITSKMIRRHPHVFAGEENDGSFDVVEWERQKDRETEGVSRSALDGAAGKSAPLARAVTLGHRAARVGFDWPDRDGVIQKIKEELEELRQTGDRNRQFEEFGDLMFALVNLARHLRLDPDSALRRANEKFERRFREVERRLGTQGRSPAEASLREMEQFWSDAKTALE